MSKIRKSRVRLSPEAREQEILQYTAQIVSEEGVFAASIERIGKALDISKSTVYSYFPSMTDLLQALYKKEMESLRAKQNAAFLEAETIEQLVRGVTHAYLEYIEEKGLLISRLQSDPSLSSVGGPTQYGRERAVKYLAETIGKTLDIPMSVAVPAVDISFGLPEAAGYCLNRKVASRKTIEDMTVAMILATIKSVKDGYEVNLKPMAKLSLDKRKDSQP